MQLETEEDIQRLIDDRIPENYILEYKKEPWPEKKGKNTASEIAKDISSFANTQGGQIIVGVEEEKKTKEPIARHPFEISNWEERIEDIRHNAIKPYIEGLRIYRIKSDEQEGKAYLIVEIPESPTAPHMVTTSNKYYRRDNSGAKPMGEAEVAELYNRRQEQAKKLELLYAPLFQKFKEIKDKIESDQTQWFCFFLPRVYQNTKIEIYNKTMMEFLKNLVNRFEPFKSSEMEPRPKGEFIQIRDFYSVPETEYHPWPSIWIHTNGGIIISGRCFSSQEPTTKWKIRLGYFVGFIEAAFQFAFSFFTEYLNNTQLKIKVHLKNVGNWRIVDFLNHYDDQFWTWLRSNPFFSYFGEEQRDGEPDVIVERYVSLWRLKKDNLHPFLKEEIFLEILRGFGHSILNE